MRKRLLSTVLALSVVAGLLAGCTNKGDAVTTSQEQDAAASNPGLVTSQAPLPSSAMPPDGQSDNNSASGEPNYTGGHIAASLDELWFMLDGTWELVEYIYDGKPTHYAEHTMQFLYVDGVPCKCNEYREPDAYTTNAFFYDIASVDEFTYDVYTYKRNGFGGEGANWSDDVRLVWWAFDLSNFADGEILLTYTIGYDGHIDDTNAFRYKLL